MKFLNALILAGLILALGGCGKDNRSGTSGSSGAGSWGYTNPYLSGLSNINSAYTSNGISVNQVLSESPCISGNGAYSNQRYQIQIQLTSFPTVIAPNDLYVGVTSYGDVGVIAGTGGAPVFIGYICPRSFTNGQGQLLGVQLGSYTQCLIKPIVAATVAFPGGGSADFRMMDYGSSYGRKFSFCR